MQGSLSQSPGHGTIGSGTGPRCARTAMPVDHSLDAVDDAMERPSGNEFVERGILDFLQVATQSLSAGDGFPRIPMASPCRSALRRRRSCRVGRDRSPRCPVATRRDRNSDRRAAPVASQQSEISAPILRPVNSTSADFRGVMRGTVARSIARWIIPSDMAAARRCRETSSASRLRRSRGSPGRQERRQGRRPGLR